jgi:plastocyanin
MRLLYGLLLALLAACGGSTPTGSGGNQNPPPVVNVSMTDNGGLGPYAFSEPSVTISVGTTVKWTNRGKADHTATSDETPAVWTSGTLEPAGTGTCEPYDPYCTPGTPAGTYARTFNTAGTFPYHCQNHATQEMTGVFTGMTGTITVTSP